MKDMTARLAEQLKNDPAALRTLMQSPDGQALIRMLTQGDRGRGSNRRPSPPPGATRLSSQPWYAGLWAAPRGRRW